MTVDDNYIDLEINLSGIVDNYDDIASIAEDLQTMIDDWLVWHLDGDCNFNIDADWG